MDMNDVSTITDQETLIVSEILCYIQNKMSTGDHDFLKKTVCEFYSAKEINDAKRLLFESCRMTTIRLKSYNKDASKLDCRDMINKLNEVGLDCPTFVAKSVDKMPLATPDAFNLAKISKDISEVLKIENNVMPSFYALSCLQKDFKYVMDKCANIDVLSAKLDALQTSIDKRHVRQIVYSSSDDDSITVDKETTDVDTTTDDEDSDSTDPVHPVPGLNARPPNINNSNESYEHEGSTVTVPQKKWLTEGGFHVVDNKSKTKTSYRDAAMNQKTRVFSNSARYQSPRPGMTLRTADTISRKRNNNNVGSDRRRGKCEIYVSNLHPDTSTHEVSRYLKANYSGYFKLEQIRNHFNDYSSFKIEAPLTLKSKLLNKYNWNADVYVRPFFKKSRNY